MGKIISKEGKTTFNKIKGTHVYDAEGEHFGHVDDIEINTTTLSPTSLLIHKGFFGEYFKIDLKYIDKITPDRIYLWICPERNLMDTKVVDCEDTEIGRVVEAEKDKDGDLEYIRIRAKVLRTRDDQGEIERYAVPMMSFEDMTISLPTSHLEEGPVPSYMDVKTKDIKIDADDIESVEEDKIVLSKKKEEYISD
ncbi:MAG: PRC-barrel domain-containing protein [Thermoplasmatota archaeon]